MKKIIIVIISLGLLVIGGLFLYQYFTKPQIVHYHAGFHVYIDGKLLSFSDPIYMNIEPCSVHATSGNDQEEKAHLHDGVGDVVHVHRSNAVWGDLFKNINYKFPDQKPIIAYINGQKISQIFSYPIKPYDSMFILVGNHISIDDYIRQAVQKTRIQQIEKLSESCGKS
jgi:hypothetical protein